MKVYVSRPRAMYDEQYGCLDMSRPERLTVFEPESNSRATGLLDVRGNPIHSVNKVEPLGFMPVRER